MSINPFSLPQETSDDIDLFGEDEGVVAARTVTSQAGTVSAPSETGEDGLSEQERKKRQALEYEEDEEGESPSRLPGTEQDYVLQNLGVPRSSDENYWMLRLPHYLKYDHRPFHPDTFQSLTDRDTAQSSSSTADRSLSIKLELASTIRWKWIRLEDGTMAKQSNSRVIKWDDGSMSLQLGNEMYDIATTNEQAIPTSSQQPESQSQSLSQSQSQHSQPSQSSSRAQGVSYIVAQHPDQQLLQVEAPITGTMSLRPVGTQSGVHLQLVRAVAQKHNKVSKLRFASDSMLAEAEKDQEALRKKGPKSTRPGMGGGASKRRRKVTASERRRRGGYSDDEDSADGYEDDMPRRRGAEEAEGRDAKGNEDYLEDEFLVADSDEDFDAGASRKKSKRAAKEDAADAVDEMDALEEMEEKIERSLAAKKDRGGEEDMDMDDEEEEGNAIQKSFGKRRKHMVADSDEE